MYRLILSLIVSFLLIDPPCLAHVRHGVDVTQGTYWISRGDFVDMLTDASPWGEYGTPTGAVPLSPSGYPLSSPSGQVSCLFSPNGYKSGICNFYGEGDFTVDIFGSATFSIVPGTLKKVDNVTTCQFSMTAAPPVFYPPPGWEVIRLSNINPDNPPKNIHLTCPGYPAYPNNPIFTNEYLAADGVFSIVRGMADSPATLQYPPYLAETDWNTRVNPNYWGQWGNSFEGAIAYCNATMTDLWIMLPVNGTDDFNRNLATLVHSTLNPKLHLYVEYCNECWNWSYPAWQMIESADLANSALDDLNGVWGRHAEQVAYKLMQARTDMQPILGSQARYVLMGQMAGLSYTCGAGLDWINRNYGPPANFIYGMGGATYLSQNTSYTDTASLFADMKTYLTSVLTPLIQQGRTLANQYNLKLVCYEGGQGFGVNSDQSNWPFVIAAETSPGMADVYATLGAALETFGVDEQVWEVDISQWNSTGTWGMVTDVRQCAAGTSPKWNEVSSLARSGDQSPARASAGTSASSHNTEAAAHAHNTELNGKTIGVSSTKSPVMTKQQYQAWVAQLAAKNAAKAKQQSLK